ncbi:hypothetical protein KIN20_008531 [Parelaphostrongylus tenuis]|uniref:Vezatin n=1 Tax=Parelaphostrongylus tenuis TaxID=148309 RepID=A0AAD5QMQ8_PARTN|nr:hypothetical protein KIN20_008531 [Parelaphostrongylus tenuis]
MFDVPSLGMLSSRYILDESRAYELLEEIDEDDITTSIAAPLSETSFPFRLSTFFLAVPFLTCYFYERYFFHPRSLSLSNFLLYKVVLCVGIVVFTGVFLWLTIKWRLRVLIQAMKTLGDSSHKANRALLERELLSFGLGLTSLRIHSTCRLRLFLFCRESIHLLSTLSKYLVSADFMSEEKERLLSIFYTNEMQELVHADVDADSSHVTQRGVGTLLDMFVLHRSELLRLIVLYLFRASFLKASSLLFRLVINLYSDLTRCITRLHVLTNTLSLKDRNRTKIRSTRNEVNVTVGLNAVVFSLDDIINGILNGTLTAVEVKMALHRVLMMACLSDSELGPPLKNNDRTTEHENHENVLHGRQQNIMQLDDSSYATRPDEVFEAIASSDGIEDDSIPEVDDGSVVQQCRELMQELRLALADRASVFNERERRALAAFYGVDYSALPRSESTAKSEEVLQQEAIPLAEASEPEGNNGVAETCQRRQSRQLPSDLLAALRMRSVVEQTIGDE